MISDRNELALHENTDLLHCAFLPDLASNSAEYDFMDSLVREGGWILMATNRSFAHYEDFRKWLAEKGYEYSELSADQAPEDYPRSLWWGSIPEPQNNILFIVHKRTGAPETKDLTLSTGRADKTVAERAVI